MAIPSGTFGPGNGSLKIKTGKEGAAAKMGHDLVIAVNTWEARIDGNGPTLLLTADPSSVEVLEGTGGAKPLSDKDKNDIKSNIAKKVLGSSQISFQSTGVQDHGTHMIVDGDLSIAGKSAPVSIPLTVVGDNVTGSVTLSQKDFGIKQFSAMMGALKVKDEVKVVLEGQLG